MTGSLQTKNDYYYIVLSYKSSNGKWKTKWINTKLKLKNNKRNAEKMLNDILLEYQGVDYIEPSNVLLCDFIKEFVNHNKYKIQLTTYDGYVHMLDKHIYPYFQSISLKLSKVKPMDIQCYHSVKLEYGLSPNTVNKHHALIRSALQYAVVNKLLKENVADLVEKPRRIKYKASYYGKEDLNVLLEVSKRTSIEVPIVLACFYGLRRSEILGLKWSAIDFENKLISISSKVVRVKQNGKFVAFNQNEMKSETSKRTLPLCDFLIEYLSNVKEHIAYNMSFLGDEYNTNYTDYVCVNEFGDLIKPDYVTSKFNKILKQNNLRKIRFHDLRHSCATLLLSLGYSMKDIQEWLGHSDFTITANTYTHSNFDTKVDMINSVGDLLK